MDVAYKPPPLLNKLDELYLINLLLGCAEIREARINHIPQYNTYVLLCIAEDFGMCKKFIKFVQETRNGSPLGMAQVRALPGFIEKVLSSKEEVMVEKKKVMSADMDEYCRLPSNINLSHVWFVPPAWMFDPWSLEKRYRSDGSDIVMENLLNHPPAWQIYL